MLLRPRARFSKARYIISKYCIYIIIYLLWRVEHLPASPSFRLSLWQFLKIILDYSRLSPSGQITNAVRSSLRSIFFGPNLVSVKAISKAITNAVRPPFRTTVKFLWQNGKFTLVIAVKWVFSIYRYDHFERGFLYWKAVTYVSHTCTMRT